MLRSMFSGVSGLRSHQTKMDVIGNNIANVNTVGFKASRVTFQEVYNQTLKAASAPTSATGRGGTNAHSIGLGVSVASIDVFHTQGGAQRTDKSTDLSLDGDGFFVLSDGTRNYYTRAGNFDEDPFGYLVSANGLKVQGWAAKDGDGNIVTTGTTREINLANLSMPPHASSKIRFEGNLNSGLEDDGIVEYTTSIIDTLGEEHSIRLVFSRAERASDEGGLEIDPNKWHLLIEPAGSDSKITTGTLYDTRDTGTFGAAEPIEFDGNGKLIYPLEGIVIPSIEFSNGAVPIEQSGNTGGLRIEFDPEKMTQNDSESTFKIAESDGYEYGTLNNITIDSMGRVIGIYSNGKARMDAVLAISRFNNPAGLLKLGDNLFEVSANSGDPIVGQAGIDGRALINPGALEMSNVDLAREFTDMIITQRGFQANSRIITTSDEILQELVNLKR
ncbi:MAG TPA: flagellar hook protein FlgE [Clostridia bacterium]|nr:flagellar hook protein FlgE [Clostridia bacterium]